jgi:hypothetical protein
MFRRAIACAVFSAASLCATEIRFHDLDRSAIEERLRLVGKSNGERCDTVRALFEKAGCADHITEQKVKHAKPPT